METPMKTCRSCLKLTKYTCLKCTAPMCILCSVYEENEDTPRWKMGYRVAYCQTCTREKNQSPSAVNESIEANEESDNHDDDDDDDDEDDEDKLEEQPSAKKSKKNNKEGPRANWTAEQKLDLADIICSDETLRDKLIFTNTKNAKNAETYKRVQTEFNERSKKRGEKPYTVPQLRSKFKKLVGICKQAALTQKTATGIADFQAKCGLWFEVLYRHVQTRDSCDPTLAIEPSYTVSPPSRTALEKNQVSNSDGASTSLTSSGDYQMTVTTTTSTDSSIVTPARQVQKVQRRQFVPTRLSGKRKKEKQLSDMLKVATDFANNDDMANLLKYMKEEAEENRKHELELVKLLMAADKVTSVAPNRVPLASVAQQQNQLPGLMQQQHPSNICRAQQTMHPLHTNNFNDTRSDHSSDMYQSPPASSSGMRPMTPNLHNMGFMQTLNEDYYMS